MADGIKRNITKEVAGAIVDTTFPTLAIAAGFPAITLATPLAKGLVLGLIENCYNDYAQRTLSISETKKMNTTSRVALEVFRELSEKDQVLAWEISIDPSYEEYAYEVADHVIQEAIRQSETKKAEVLGWYYGKRIYEGPGDWQDMHQIITMAGALTFRQIVLIRLICEGFKGYDPEWFITNQSACVEVNRLQDYGLWFTEMARFKDDSSATIQLQMIKPTHYAKMVYEVLMLDRLSDDDVKRTLESLGISEKGEKAEGITKEEFEASTSMDYDEVNEGLFFGKKASIPDDIALMTRGQGFVTDAKNHNDKGNMMMAIDCIMKAVDEYKKCRAEKLCQSSIDDALELLKDYFGQCEEYGGLRILSGRRAYYEGVLRDIKSDYIGKCRDYLAKAEEKAERLDRELKQKAINDLFEV